MSSAHDRFIYNFEPPLYDHGRFAAWHASLKVMIAEAKVEVLEEAAKWFDGFISDAGRAPYAPGEVVNILRRMAAEKAAKP